VIFGALLLVFALSGMVDRLAKLFTQPVVRGIQLSLRSGLPEKRRGADRGPAAVHVGGCGSLAEYRANLIIGVIVFGLVLALLDNKKLPAALAAVAAGIAAGLTLGGFDRLHFSSVPPSPHHCPHSRRFLDGLHHADPAAIR